MEEGDGTDMANLRLGRRQQRTVTLEQFRAEIDAAKKRAMEIFEASKKNA